MIICLVPYMQILYLNLKTLKLIVSGIQVKHIYKGFNIAFKPELVDQKVLTIVEASHIRIEFFENRRTYPIYYHFKNHRKI